MTSTPTPDAQSKKLGCRGCFLILLIGFFLFLAFVGIWIFTAFNSAPEPGQPLFEPSIAANYITSPLDANGDVDYKEFINQEASKGVSAENNAMVKIVEAVGPIESVPADFYFRLGISIPPANETYFIGFNEWNKTSTFFDEDKELKFLTEYESDRGYQVWDYATEHPWSPEKFPGLAAYIDAQATVFQRTVAASQRKNYYAPMVVEPPDKPIFISTIPYHQKTRDLARLLAIRSNMNLATGKTRQAIDDALAIVRLGEHMSAGNTLIESLVGMAIRGIGFRQVLSIARQPETSIDDLRHLRDLAQKLRKCDVVLTIISKRERLMTLDATSKLIRNGYASEDSYYFGDEAAAISMLAKTGDAEAAMTEINALYDEFESIFEQAQTDPSFEFETAYEQIGFRLDVETNNPFKNYFLMLLNKRARGQQLGKVLGGLFFPSADAVWNAERRVNSELNLLRLAIEIEIYKRSNDRYPETLDQLVPNQLTEIPSDPFARTQEYGYRKTDTGYRVYSFGNNQVDDGGHNPMLDYSDEGENYDADDWFFEDNPSMTWEEFLEDKFGFDDSGMSLDGFEFDPDLP